MTRRLISKYLYVTVTYISWSNEFALYLEDCFGIMSQYDTTFDLEINVDHFMVQ